MPHMIKIEEAHYRYLEKAAHIAGLSVDDFVKRIIAKQRLSDERIPGGTASNEQCHEKSRWEKLSERIQKKPPLRGAGDYVRKCSREFREDFTLHHDVE